ncbi:hypothetical protein EL17_21405 [Anditalea andensis]|uniref:Uncharacterized protein n=1 Tax=Anditalea andensis TaxID=1048983 RepID=A0A074KU11_9BACT|nr:hypothetical protein EL17_21405 [Anditalea andensis]
MVFGDDKEFKVSQRQFYKLLNMNLKDFQRTKSLAGYKHLLAKYYFLWSQKKMIRIKFDQTILHNWQ